MEHLSQQQIVALIDGRLDDAEERLHNTHLAHCVRCRDEVALQRSLGAVVHALPLEKTSSQFTQRTMNRILRTNELSFSYKVLQHVASAVAMLAVLVVLGYILSSPVDFFSSSDSSATSTVFSSWKTFYGNVSTALAKDATRLNNMLAGQTSTPVSKVVVMTFLVLIGYAALDRFVLRKMARMKMHH